MQVVICAIAKNEHLYINEWVKYYISLCIDHIYLYDNDNLNSPYIGDCIDKDYLDKVTIYNCRGVKKPYLQHDIYNNFYHTHKFEWVFFVDIDEYLVGVDNIKKIVNERYDQIRIKWKLFGDDNLIERDTSKPLFNAFKQEKHDKRLEYQGKSIIRGGLNIEIHSCHYAKYLNSCFPNGTKCQSNRLELLDYTNQNVFINHYMTKSLLEFINQKLGRGDAVWKDRSIDFSYFWQINEKTKDKLDFIKNIGLE